MKELIRHILKEETSDLKKPFMRYEKLINKLVYEVFDEGICGLSWDVIKLYYREGISLRIILHFTYDSLEEFGYERYGQSKQELKNLIEDYLPKFNGIYIAYDTTKCDKDTISLNENKKRNYLRQLNDIVEPYKEDECICDINIHYDEEDDMYSVYVVTSTECLAEKFDNSATFIVRKISKIKHDIKQEIKSFLPIENIYVGSYGKPNCDWDPVRRIDEDYSPAGKEVTPNEIVVHKSNPMFRDKIMSQGLKARAGECYKIYVGYGEKCIPAIFATNSTNKRAWFDSTYDDDIWFIDTTKIPDVKWFKDRHYESRSKHIVTFQDIPKEAITLKYEGTGSGDVKTWNKKSPNLFENKDEQFSEDINKLKLITNLINDSDIFDYKHFCGVDIIPAQERTDQYNFLNKNKIPFLIKVYFVGGPNSEVWPRTQAIRNKELDLIENLHDHIKSFVPYNIEIMGSHVTSCEGYEKLMKRKYTKDEDGDVLDEEENTEGVGGYAAPAFEMKPDHVHFKHLYNESDVKKSKYKTMIKDLIDPIKDEKTVCDVNVEYDRNNEKYEIEIVFDVNPNLYKNKHFVKDDKGIRHFKDHRNMIKKKILEYIKEYLPIKNINVKLSTTDKRGNDLNEQELTEKCWKGYTQKGMKTMFGKRYPNCVKKTKK